MLPYCFPHEPAESKAARQPKEGEMTKVTESVTSEPMSTPIPSTKVEKSVAIGGGWVVNAKNGTELCNGFASKKEASKWAALEVESKRLKAGQYKIAKIS